MSKENQMTIKSSERRRYERYMALIQTKVDEKSPIEISVDGVTVDLVDFALGGLYVLADKCFTLGETVNLSIRLGKTGTITLLGTVVRMNPEPDNERWGIAIDLSQFYGLKFSRKA